MNRLPSIWSIALILCLTLTACSTQKPTNNAQGNTTYPAPQNAANSSYPAPSGEIPGYLNPTNAPYPIPASPTPNPGTSVKVVPFQINKPVADGATEVSGTGPAYIPITLADITMYGDVLGQTTIKPDGTFVFTLSKPIGKGHLIGVALSELSKTKWVISNFSNPGFNGDSPKQVPLVGYFYDTVEVGK
jgi:hypothetical protein